MLAGGKILLGCVIGVLSSATQSVGLTLQRKSHVLEDLNHLNNSSYEYKQPYKRPLWRIGFILFLVANLLGSSIQITTLPLIILSPLQAVGLVFNSICAAIILNENFTQYSIAGTVLVGFGALFIAAFGSIEEPNHSLDELLQLMKRTHFVIWFIFSNLFVVLVLLWIHTVKLLHSKKANHDVLDKLPELIRQLVDLPVEKFKFLRGCAYGVVSGILSAHSLLLAKSAVEIIINSLTSSSLRNFENFRCWAIISSFFILAITQLIFLNKGLRNVSTSVLYPLVFCIYNITNIINGLVFYDQLQVLSLGQIFMIVLGTVLVLVGVFSLSWRLDEAHVTRDIASYPKDSIDERTLLFTPTLDDEGEVGYISFGSPKHDHSSVSLGFNEDLSSHDNESALGSSSPITPFKYGTILDNSNNPVKTTQIKSNRKSRRVLSYEQNELLSQLQNVPDP